MRGADNYLHVALPSLFLVSVGADPKGGDACAYVTRLFRSLQTISVQESMYARRGKTRGSAANVLSPRALHRVSLVGGIRVTYATIPFATTRSRSRSRFRPCQAGSCSCAVHFVPHSSSSPSCLLSC